MLLVPALVSAIGTLGAIALPVAGAHADTVAQLPVTGFTQIVADTAHHHLFLGSLDAVVVTDLAGAEVTTLDAGEGVAGITLSPDGSTLYVALTAEDAVSAVSTATLTQTALYQLGSGNAPSWVAVQNGTLWVSYRNGTSGDSSIGSFDTGAADAAFVPQALSGPRWSAPPSLSADPDDSGMLVAADGSGSPITIATYNVAASSSPLAQSSNFADCLTFQDAAVTPGGAQVVLACAGDANHYRYDTASLTQEGDYASGIYPDAIAIAPDGSVAAGTGNENASAIYVYRPDGTTPVNTYQFTGSLPRLAPRGLAWSADGTQLFAVIQQASIMTVTNTYYLHIIQYPALTATAVGLFGPSTAVIGSSVTLAGYLNLGANAAPAGIPVTITRTLAGSSTSTQFGVTTASDGSITLTDTPAAWGNYTYTAHYAGDATYAPATYSLTVTITPLQATLTVATGGTAFNYDSTIHVTAHLGTTDTNRTVSVYAQPFGSATKSLLKTGTVDSNGNLAVSYVAPHSTTFSAVFTGDAQYASRTVAQAVGVRARVALTISGYYASKLISGTTYRIYHRTAHLGTGVTVTPNKHGECLKLEIQEYYQGAWHVKMITGCGHLNSSSKGSWALTISQAHLNSPYRIRADYIRSSADTSNLSSDSGWQYFLVEK